MTGTVAVVLKGYPRLSETFIAEEILGLQRARMTLRIVSLRHPTDRASHPVHGEITAPVNYLPEYLYQEPGRVLRGWWAARRLAGYGTALATWWRDLRRDPSPNRIRRFGQALVLAHELPADVVRLHAHFLHTPASVARYAAQMRGLDWSFSAHARDIWTTPAWEIREKLADCHWAVTCSQGALAALIPLAPEPARVSLVYHGIDLARFAAPDSPRPARDGSNEDDPVMLLTVGRAVPKKGHDVLIDALALLPAGLNWRWVHIGGGELRGALKARAGRAGLSDRIDWRGAVAQADVLAAYRAADLFVLANRIAADGDRDGLPNVLVEAQSQGLACVASNAASVPELIEDGVNGALAPPDDAAALADRLAALIADPATRQAMGAAGRRIVADRFDNRRGISRIAALFAADGLAPMDDNADEHATRRRA
ncbi:MAG: glycosyltransferase family 4 protein [Alphaproteobacteria bacterium]